MERSFCIAAPCKEVWGCRIRPSIVSLLLLLPAVGVHAAAPLDIGGRRELFVDRKLIEAMNGVELRMHAPKPEETAMDGAGKTTISKGHKVLSSAAGKAEIENERYPFCFDPDPKSSGSTRSILLYLPFNKDLNRFTLKVTNLASPKARVTWGRKAASSQRHSLKPASI